MKYFFLLFICALMVGCLNEGDCLISATNYVRIQFKKRKNTAQDTLIRFAYKSIEFNGNDTTIRSATSQILLPLNENPDSTSTTFIFHRIISFQNDTTVQAIDTLRIGYSKQAKIISKDCGAYTFYQDLKVKKLTTTKDTIAIKTFSKSLLKDPTGSATSATSYVLNYQILY